MHPLASRCQSFTSFLGFGGKNLNEKIWYMSLLERLCALSKKYLRGSQRLELHFHWHGSMMFFVRMLLWCQCRISHTTGATARKDDLETYCKKDAWEGEHMPDITARGYRWGKHVQRVDQIVHPIAKMSWHSTEDAAMRITWPAVFKRRVHPQ